MLQSFAKSSFRELLERASKTQPTSNVRPLHSLDSLARAALDSTPTVVDAELAEFEYLHGGAEA